MKICHLDSLVEKQSDEILSLNTALAVSADRRGIEVDGDS